METKQFHFMLSPVQSFISQARRTRDFWAGSFLLSWLSAVAMQAVIKQNPNYNSIVFPLPDEDFLNWLEGNETGKKPAHGSVPSRFQAEVIGDFKPQDVVKSVQIAWKSLADKIYQGDLKNVANPKTKEIWDRQIEHFWHIEWVLSEDHDNCILDQRKHWHTYIAPEQAGVKCMMTDGWQELSGIASPNATELNDFWNKVIQKGKLGIASDLRQQEYLSAPAFVKRRFVRYFHELKKIPMPSHWQLSGWKMAAARPSVSYMAAVHWLENLLQAEKTLEIEYLLRQFHKTALELTDGNHNEWDSNIACIKNKKVSSDQKWLALDGNIFFESLLENSKLYPEDKQPAAKSTLELLRKLCKLLQLPAVTPFYAVLRMDGDNLSKQRMDNAKTQTIAKALAEFTKAVPNLVYEKNGFLIYAGGDDVLAILPLEDALSCALAIRIKYAAIFAENNKKVLPAQQVETTISAAIEYAHIKIPLARVLKDSHHLLDEVAKKQYGRDSVAVRVLKSGGQTLEWARPWDKAIEKSTIAHLAENLSDDDLLNKDLTGYVSIGRLAQDLQQDDDLGGHFSHRFLYKIRERFELLNPKDKDETVLLDHADAIELMAAEYVSAGLCDKNSYLESTATVSKKMAHARAVTTPLLEQCRSTADNKLSVDAALLMRFLAQKGVE